MFTKREGSNIVVMLVYVDDVLITRNNEQSWYDKWTELQFVLKRNFKVKNLGDLQYFLGIGIARTDEGIVLNQKNMP